MTDPKQMKSRTDGAAHHAFWNDRCDLCNDQAGNETSRGSGLLESSLADAIGTAPLVETSGFNDRIGQTGFAMDSPPRSRESTTKLMLLQTDPSITARFRKQSRC